MISLSLARNLVLIILSLTIVFHLLVISGILPGTIVWGGRADEENFIMLELVSISINLFMFFIVCVYSGIIKLDLNAVFLKITLWVMVLLFILNSVGNLFSKNETEKMIFTPVTVVLAALCSRLALSRPFSGTDHNK